MTNANAMRATGYRYAETPVQKIALVFGIVFLLVGIAGFIPGLTSNVDKMQFAGESSQAMLLGIFQVSVLHNIIHLLYGVAGLALARSRAGSRNYLIWGGVVYAVVWLYGLFFGGDSNGNFVPLNSADNWLHLILAIAMILLGVFLGRAVGTRTRRPGPVAGTAAR